jgi:thiol peroxidase
LAGASNKKLEQFMTSERTGIFKYSGRDVTIVGPDLLAGHKAPEFSVLTQDGTIFNGLKDTQGKIRIIGSLLSLSTSVCDPETRRFNQEAASLDARITIMTISMDLPFTLKHWCAAAGVDRVITLSDHINMDFGQKYGVLLKELRVFRRAVFVVNSDGVVTYSAYMPVLAQEPNYPEVLEAARQALRA